MSISVEIYVTRKVKSKESSRRNKIHDKQKSLPQEIPNQPNASEQHLPKQTAWLCSNIKKAFSVGRTQSCIVKLVIMSRETMMLTWS